MKKLLEWQKAQTKVKVDQICNDQLCTIKAVNANWQNVTKHNQTKKTDKCESNAVYIPNVLEQPKIA